MFFELQKTLGLSTGVIVSPGGYGKDYSMLADVLAKHPQRFRGIALVKDDIAAVRTGAAHQTRREGHADDEHQARLPMCRTTIPPASRRKVHEHGWHIQFYPHGTDITEYADKLLSLKNDIVLDFSPSIPRKAASISRR